jgi:hypothetical protein
LDELDAEKRRESGEESMFDVPESGDILERDSQMGDLGIKVEKVQ